MIFLQGILYSEQTLFTKLLFACMLIHATKLNSRLRREKLSNDVECFHFSHIMQLIQPSPIYIPTCTWLPSGTYLPWSPWTRICKEGKAFLRCNCWFESFLCSQSHWGTCRHNFLPCVSSCKLPCGMSCGEMCKVNSWLQWSHKRQVEFYFIVFMLSLVSLQNDSISFICLLLKLIQVTYYAYFTCGRTDTGQYHSQIPMQW